MAADLLLATGALSALLWLVFLALPWRPWAARPRLETPDPAAEAGASAAATGAGAHDLSDITVLIPARNEADHLPRTLEAVREQGRGHRVVVVDDESTDGTADGVRATARRWEEAPGEAPRLELISGRARPAGWAGKVWALEQGRRRVETPLTLLLDADVEPGAGLVAALRRRMRDEEAQLASLMAEPRMRGFWGKLLMPAFVYFFQILYPFRLSNDPDSRVAAAAGGCVLLETRLFGEMGGLSAIRDEIIDDCALAGRVKEAGARTWIGLSRSVRSRRAHDGLREIWSMVARTAFTQLRYSPALLGACTAVMALAFAGPLAALAGPGRPAGGAALAMMWAAYLPTLRYYGRSPAWTLLLPVTAGLYLAMTWWSAAGYWRGRRSRWKGRVYGVGDGKGDGKDVGDGDVPRKRRDAGNGEAGSA